PAAINALPTFCASSQTLAQLTGPYLPPVLTRHAVSEPRLLAWSRRRSRIEFLAIAGGPCASALSRETACEVIYRVPGVGSRLATGKPSAGQAASTPRGLRPRFAG